MALETIEISPTKRLVVEYDDSSENPLDWGDNQGVINCDYDNYFGTYNGGLSYAIQQANEYGQDEFTAAQKYAKRNGLKVERLTAQDYGRSLDAVIWTLDDENHYLETEAFKRWIEGEVYRVTLEELDTDSDVWDETDSIGGCYLDTEYTALDVAREHFDLSEKEEDPNPEKENAKSKFTLTIELGNDAMQDEHDVTRALEDVLAAGAISGGWTKGVIYDDNGNTVGKWSFQ